MILKRLKSCYCIVLIVTNYQDLSRSPIITSITKAGIAQLVEHNLAKVGVASSSLVSRDRLWYLQMMEHIDFFSEVFGIDLILN